ncbi:MAG: DNA-binding protein WhiA [Schwartzia sp.]|nr:DNA-binding protein WhiA [Schwartzia sp. (in: firmicutes)]
MSSFSGEVKHELARLPLAEPCCVHAELGGLFRMGASITLGAKGALGATFTTEHAAVARRAFVLLKQAGILRTEIAMRRFRRLGKNNSYLLRVPPGAGVEALLEAEGVSPDLQQLQPHGGTFLRRPCCRVSYLRGAFLAGGSVNRPEASYHLEYATTNYQLAELLHSLLRRLEFPAGLTGRKEDYVVYLKEGDAILDFLAMLGAEEAATAFEAARNVKDVRNQVNRLVNCETANLNKTAAAAAKQIAVIRELAASGRLASLAPGLREAAEARLSHPEASLSELGEMLGLGRSGVNHRLRRIMDVAAEA